MTTKRPVGGLNGAGTGAAPAEPSTSASDPVASGSGPRVVLRDPTLTHQIVIGNDANGIYVSCNCRAVHRSPWAERYVPMTHTSTAEGAKRIYNEANRHWLPFGPEWRLEVDG